MTDVLPDIESVLRGALEDLFRVHDEYSNPRMAAR